MITWTKKFMAILFMLRVKNRNSDAKTKEKQQWHELETGLFEPHRTQTP